MSTRTVAALVGATVIAAMVGPGATADPPANQADCVGQFVTDFQNLFSGFTIGEVQGQLDVQIPGYVFPTGGQAHFLQPFGQLLLGQATAPHDRCPFDLTP
jgi:hypothetical protein